MGSSNYFLSRKNQVGLLLAILVVALHLVIGFGVFWSVAALAAYGAGAVLTPAPRQQALQPPMTPTPQLLSGVLRETSSKLFRAKPPAVVVAKAKELESNVRFVLSEWDHLDSTPEHRQTMWNVVKVYYPEITTTFLDSPQHSDGRAAAVMADSLTTLASAVDRIKTGILDDNLRAMDSQAQFLRTELGALPGLNDGFEEAEGYDRRS
ncbi:hypothetical protein [Corynebacterium riegelii]